MPRNIYLRCPNSPARIRIAFPICMVRCNNQCGCYHEIVKELREKHVRYTGGLSVSGEAGCCDEDQAPTGKG